MNTTEKAKPLIKEAVDLIKGFDAVDEILGSVATVDHIHRILHLGYQLRKHNIGISNGHLKELIKNELEK